MNAEARRRACLAASLVAAWNAVPATPAEAGVFVPDKSTAYTRLNLSGPISTVRFVMFSDGTPDFIFNMGALPAGDSLRSIGLGSGAPDIYAFVGAGLGSGGGVYLSFSNSNTAVDKPFETLFPTLSESQVADAITNGGSALTSFLTEYGHLAGALSSMGTSSSGVHFSNGVPDGTAIASFTPVPEPGSALLCLGAAGFGLFVRRRPAVAVRSSAVAVPLSSDE